MNKSEFVEYLKNRTKKLAVDIVLFYKNLDKCEASRVMGRQLIRSATSTAANYRAACISRSQKEFFSKMSIVVEEADETLFWLEMFRDTGFVSDNELEPLMTEALEILKIVSKARKNASNN